MESLDSDQTRSELQQLRLELLSSVYHLSERCLFQASKWSAEALNSLDLPETDKDPIQTIKLVDKPIVTDKEILAKTFFDCHEYDRCAYLLRDTTTPLGLFLKLYALYISGEKKREEEHEGVLSPKDGTSPNRQVVRIIRELDEYFESHKPDPFLLYLHGVALIRQKKEKEALQKLVESVNMMPYNWSAWQEIYTCLDTIESLHSLIPSLPRHLMTRVFTVYAHQEFFQHEDIDLEELNDILTFMPTFNFLITQKALIHYHGLEYDESEAEFQQVLKSDPHRLDDMDTYSNILYVMERRPTLAFLAQLASSTDKFRPETCCIIANYYSLKSEHEKAITYYQRALTLNRNCLSAWTLMGHEFVELKNTHAAIESYRHAIDVNKKDFRAWYGLGQAYEVLDMNYYSLYYYQRAASIKPMDARMWQALGNCYERLGKYTDAILTYQRALYLSEMNDPTILLKLALIEEKCGYKDRAAKYMRRCLFGTTDQSGFNNEEGGNPSDNLDSEADEGQGTTGEDGSATEMDERNQARMWLARYEMSRENWKKANEYAKGLLHGLPSEMEEARAIVKDTNSRLLGLLDKRGSDEKGKSVQAKGKEKSTTNFNGSSTATDNSQTDDDVNRVGFNNPLPGTGQ